MKFYIFSSVEEVAFDYCKALDQYLECVSVLPNKHVHLESLSGLVQQALAFSLESYPQSATSNSIIAVATVGALTKKLHYFGCNHTYKAPRLESTLCKTFHFMSIRQGIGDPRDDTILQRYQIAH